MSQISQLQKKQDACVIHKERLCVYNGDGQALISCKEVKALQSLSTKWLACSILFVFFLTAFTRSDLTSPAAHATTGNGSPTDPNIKYIGRWDISSSAVHTSNWTGAY